MRNAGEKLHGVLAKDLQIPLRPAHALPPGLGKARGLLIIEHRTSCVADLFPAGNIVDGKFDVLREQEEVPAAARFQHTVGKQKACAGHGAAGAQQEPGVVEIPALPQEPQGITGADPVVAVVLAVAEAGDDVVARLLSFNNVIVTSHQGFFTREAMHNIAETTLQNIQDFIDGKTLVNEVS